MTAHRPALGASIAVFRNGSLLVATRVKPPYAGLYSLPGGHVEAGETLEEAALRELDEELGIKARIIGFNQHVETIRWPQAAKMERHFVIASFVGVWLAGEANPNAEVGEARWIEPSELAALPVTPGLLEVVAKATQIYASFIGA
jgi:8-oxo-dGTP diphosphatase